MEGAKILLHWYSGYFNKCLADRNACAKKFLMCAFLIKHIRKLSALLYFYSKVHCVATLNERVQCIKDIVRKSTSPISL